MIYGTSHFPSLIDALSYYDDYGVTALGVKQKIADKSITIAKPPLKKGDRLFVKQESSYLGDDGKPVPTYRYFVETAPIPEAAFEHYTFYVENEEDCGNEPVSFYVWFEEYGEQLDLTR